MIRLAIICFLISTIRSNECNLNIDDVNQLKHLFDDSERLMEDATRGQSENAVIVLGNVRSGKSTLINYLMGNELQAYRESGRFPEIKIKKSNENVTGPEIGAGSLLVTTIPSKWNSRKTELQNFDIWDTAGFENSRDEMQDLNKAFHLYHLTKKVESLKFILVIDFNDIRGDNNQQILTLLSILEKYFNGMFKHIFPSISVIISKAPKEIINAFPIDDEFLNYKLSTNLLSSSELDIPEVLIDFIHHVINNNQRVAFFRKAKTLGRLTSYIDDNIIPAINNCKSISKESHQNISFPISKRLELCLQVTNDNLLNMNDFTALTSVVNERYIKNYNYLNNTLDRGVLLQNETNFQEIYNHLNISSFVNSNAMSKIEILENSHNTFKNIIKEINFVNRISLTEFIDSIIKTKKIVRINILLETILQLLHDRTSILISLCQLKLNKIDTNQFHNIMMEMKTSQKETIDKLSKKIEREKIPKHEESFWLKVVWAFTDAAFLQ
ncbi:uncharacterized protein LOC122503467 [Leptopilina heterotoma]|uniref:uncharacterized protein LOC122503467 n=1 Tax=Leptopilina heterotoma TaxID=63436 RepID=UPI001CA7C4B2|nr:uncharacterized protein LOC122503467 [Leptopilina heterotoma]XP_043469962.1 uncharacterized protein LOC122503467 [Leptopilina heterotoma]